jgi:hypothetical protein
MDYSHWFILLHGGNRIAGAWRGEAPGLLAVCIPRFCSGKRRCHVDVHTHKVSSNYRGFVNKS